MEDKKKFTHPEATIILFINDDIITNSGDLGQGKGQGPFDEYED